MYDYKTVKSFWTKWLNDWQKDVKENQKEVFDFWSKFFSK
jgi:cytoplasmic iron level regulating protein YaaA (DUF328/UPF0246 family)